MEKMKSNSKINTLASKIEQLKHKLDLNKALVELEQSKLDDVRKSKVDSFKFKLSKNLLKLERESIPAEELFNVENQKNFVKFDKKLDLEYRAKRQTLRRDENLVDKQNNVTGELSSKAQAELVAFKGELDAKKIAHVEALRAKFKQLQEPKTTQELAQAVSAYEKAQSEADDAAKAFDLELIAKHNEKIEGYKAKVDVKITAMQKGYDESKSELNALQKEDQKSQYQLADDTILKLEHLTMQFGGLKAVNDLSFEVKKGEIFGLIGPNGAGKTTVFNCITQFYKPTSGDVWYKDAKDQVHYLNDYVVHNVIRYGIVRTFQNVEVIAELSILENLLIAAHTQYKTSIFAQMINSPHLKREEILLRRKAQKILKYLKLDDIQDVPPVGMPYGVLKKIELARTLMAGANLIILDEPAAGLNDQETLELAEIIKDIKNEYKVTIFLVEHDMGLVMDICDHICAISFGSKLAYGTPSEIQSNKKVQEAYLGSED